MNPHALQGIAHHSNAIALTHPTTACTQYKARETGLGAVAMGSLLVLESAQDADAKPEHRKKCSEYKKANKQAAETGVPHGLPKPELKGTPPGKGGRKLVPVRTTVPIAKAVFYEEWISDLEHAIQPLWHDLKHGASQLSGEVQDLLRREVAWLYSAGHWVQDAASKSYVYLNAQRQVLSRWTQEQLDRVWEQIVSFTDLTKAAFQRIEWMQIITHYAKDVAVFLVCLVIAGVIVVFAIPQALIAGFIALLGVWGLSAAAA